MDSPHSQHSMLFNRREHMLCDFLNGSEIHSNMDYNALFLHLAVDIELSVKAECPEWAWSSFDICFTVFSPSCAPDHVVR